MRTVKHFTVECKTCRRIGIQYAKPVYSSVHEPVLPYRTVHRRLIFFSPEINPCEIHENFHCKPNAMHRPVIHQSVKPLHRDVVYPTVPHDLTQNDEADRVLLCTGHHGQKSERICDMAYFSLTSKPVLPTRKQTTREYGGKN